MRRDLLTKAAQGSTLSRDEARDVGRDLAAGRTEPLLCAAFLAALSARGETAEELAGLAEAFRESVLPMRPFPHAVDTCGTGGDGRHTFNLSTASALVAASMGATVAKHGNRSVSSACGSADLLEHAGIPIDGSPEECEERLLQLRFAFLSAPRFHPAMAHVAPVRKALGIRTAFNLLGPLLNPAGALRQVVGVYARSRASIVAESLSVLGTDRAFVVHGSGGYDEVVLHGPVSVIEVNGQSLDTYELDHSHFGLPEGRHEDLAGGDPAHNFRILHDLLDGHGPAPLRDAVAAGAALALKAAGLCEDLREGAGRAVEAIGSGQAGRLFHSLIENQGEVRCAQVS